MKMFSNCSGECCVCRCGEGCLAGHGDDDFSPASADIILKRLDEGKYPSFKSYMIDYLEKQYSIIYTNRKR